MERWQNIPNEAKRVNYLLSLKDYTDPEAGTHPVGLVMDRIVENIAESGEYPHPKIIGGEKITTVSENFDSLLFPANSVMASENHTIFIDELHILRSQMAYLLPTYLKDRPFQDEELVVAPGLVYRTDGTHHQMDVWYIKKTNQPFTQADVRGLIDTIVGFVPEEDRTYKPKSLYYFHNGLGMKVNLFGKRLTVVDGGIIVPDLFRNAGLDPSQYQGIALGVSLDRLAMYVKGIRDHEVLRSRNPHDLSQMGNLEPYRENTEPLATPSIRDISLCVDGTIGLDEILQVINSSFDETIRASIIGAEVKFSVPYDGLGEERRSKLGIKSNEKNMLIRFRLRSSSANMNGKISKEEGNKIRDDIFSLINGMDRRKYNEIVRSSPKNIDQDA